MIRFHVAAEDHEELRLHCLWLGIPSFFWADVLDDAKAVVGHVFVIDPHGGGNPLGVLTHPKVTMLPPPHSPHGITDAHAAVLGAIGATAGEPPRDVYARLYARNPHPLLHPDLP